MRPISILLNTYLPECYKIETGSMRKVLGKYLGRVSFQLSSKKRSLMGLLRFNRRCKLNFI